MSETNSKTFDFIVIGGGIVGLASAYKIALKYPAKSLLLLEKEEHLAAHQTGRNSGVIHSGIYYKPGSYKATNCVAGRRELVEFCKIHKIPHDICGKIIVATHPSELPILEKIYSNGIQNGIEDMRYINAEEIKKIEPFCEGIKGIFVGCTGIIDYPAVCEKLSELIQQINPENKILTGYTCNNIIKNDSFKTVNTEKESFNGKYLVFCGGLFSDRLAKSDQVQIHSKIVGFRGDYYELSEKGKDKVKNLIYPVPNPDFPFLGVHFTRMIHGGVECGPNAVFTFKREGYLKTDFSFRDTIDALSYSGTWRLLFKHWRFGLDEYRRAFSKRLFLNRLKKLIPSLTMEDIEPGRSGVRAMALGADGSMIEDFSIEYSDRSIHILNAPSPAATSALAIGSAVSEMVSKHV